MRARPQNRPANLAQPRLFGCAPAAAWVVAADKLWLPLRWLFASPALLVGLPSERPERPRVQGEVLYCAGVHASLPDALLAGLMGHAPR